MFAQKENIYIPYLEKTPVIDGLPDMDPAISDWIKFPYIEKTNDKNADYEIQYKIRYGISYLYLIKESGSDTIKWRDRDYQNGDGFHMVIANPDSSGMTDKFYVLRFSPDNKKEHIPVKKGVWYYNVDLCGKSLSSAAKFMCNTSNGKSYFELLLPWSETNPYHPLFSHSIGINLSFVKAVGEKEKNYYFIKFDDQIQSEMQKKVYFNICSDEV